MAPGGRPDQDTLVIGPDPCGCKVVVQGRHVLDACPGQAGRGCPGGGIHPGAVNAHTHIYSGLAPLGLPAPRPEPQNFLQILERLWWRLDRALDAQTLRAAARFYVARALLAGTTTLVDHHESPHFIEGSLDVLADVCQELGMRALLCYGASERNFGAEEAERGLAECRRFILANDRPLVRGLVGLHASFTVSDDTLRRAGQLCRELDTVLHVHLAEDAADVEDARRRGYPGPLERLLALEALPAGSILAHGVHLSAHQVALARQAGCWIVQNPRSNHGNRVGYPRALRASHLVALGTDGYPSDMAAEFEFLQEMALSQGEPAAAVEARARAGWDLLAQRFGEAFAPPAPGSVADLVVRDEEGIRHVLVDGRPVVRDRQLVTADLGEIEARAAEQAAILWKRMESLTC